MPLLTSFLRPLEVTVAGSRIYNGTTDVASLATYSVAPDATLLGTPVANTASSNVSVTPYVVTSAGLFSTQLGYDISYIAGSITITPAPLTVIANSQNKVLGTPDPLMTYMTYGLMLNDSAATIFSGQLLREVGDTIGTYSINQGDLTLLSSNYTMIYVAGTFRILAPTVVQEITQMSLQSAPAEDAATTSEEEEKKKSAELLAEAAIVDDSGQPLSDPLPVCR